MKRDKVAGWDEDGEEMTDWRRADTPSLRALAALCVWLGMGTERPHRASDNRRRIVRRSATMSGPASAAGINI